MFIELTDHLRCPADHPEQYLVLLPDRVQDRLVLAGTLACPVCGRTYPVAGGVADFGGAPPAAACGSALDADALAALLGLDGPGGYVVTVGSPATGWPDLAVRLGGVHVAAVNPDPGLASSRAVSVLRAARIPLKARSVRGVVLGGGAAVAPAWLDEAARVVLPGRHVVGEGPPPAHPTLAVVASAPGAWVAVATGQAPLARPSGPE